MIYILIVLQKDREWHVVAAAIIIIALFKFTKAL